MAPHRRPVMVPAVLLLLLCFVAGYAILYYEMTSGTREATFSSRRLFTLRLGGEPGPGPRIPRIIHHMHKDFYALNDEQRSYYQTCLQHHHDWTFMFWDDQRVETFVKTNFPWYYPTWMDIHPLIKKIDTSRYLIVYFYGGVYLDVDMECVTPLDGLIAPLESDVAWVGDWPDPAVLMSPARHVFWLHMLVRIARVWGMFDAIHATGPLGLNDAVLEWVQRYGTGVIAPFWSSRTEPEFHSFIKGKNNTVPWFSVANGDWDMDAPEGATIWHNPEFYKTKPSRRLPFYNGTETAGKRIGFLANELLQVNACNLPTCQRTYCNTTFPFTYVVHHCFKSWMGRIDEQ